MRHVNSGHHHSRTLLVILSALLFEVFHIFLLSICYFCDDLHLAHTLVNMFAVLCCVRSWIILSQSSHSQPHLFVEVVLDVRESRLNRYRA